MTQKQSEKKPKINNIWIPQEREAWWPFEKHKKEPLTKKRKVDKDTDQKNETGTAQN